MIHKSNRTYVAWKEALKAAKETPGAPVPLHIRNAPTDLMRELGYGAGYRYDPDETHGVAFQTYLPETLEGRSFYRPSPHGHEATIQKRLDWWAKRRTEALGEGEVGGEEVEQSSAAVGQEVPDPGKGRPGNP